MTNLARKAAESYVKIVNARDLEAMMDLFADNGKLIHPIGEFERDALGSFYGDIVFKADTELTCTTVFAEGNLACAEVVGVSPQAPDQPQLACDVFQVNDEGKVTELRIYYKAM